MRIQGVSQLLVRRGSRGKILMIAAKVKDDALMEGSIDGMRAMTAEINELLPISKALIGE